MHTVKEQLEYEDCNYEPVASEELISPDDQRKKKWHSAVIAALVIMAICAIVAVIIYFISREKSQSSIHGKPVAFNDFLLGTLYGTQLRYKWLQDNLLAYEDSNANLGLLRIENGNLISKDSVDTSSYNGLASFNAEYIAYQAESDKVYRYSSRSMYKIALIEDGMLKTHYSVNTIKKANDTQFMRLFKWNPRGSDYVFVYENDIYYRPSPADHSELAIRITWNSMNTTDEHDLLSGVADWLYEEEILYTDEAMWWSSDGRYLAYATFDNRLVKRMTLDYYPDIQEDLYPKRKSIPYPKCGERLPLVTLNVWSKEKNDTVLMRPPMEVDRLGEYYLFSVSWPNITAWTEAVKCHTPLLVIWANRVQNLAYITLCNVCTGKCILNYVANKDLANRNGTWLEPMDMKVPFANGSHYFVMLYNLQSDGYYYKHIASVSVDDNGQAARDPQYLTSGTWEVIQIVGYNPTASILYFLAADPLPRRKNLFSVSTANSTSGSIIQCLTCWMSDSYQCSYVNVGFSNDGDHYVLSCDGPGIPFTILRSASLNKTVFNFPNDTHLYEYVSKTAMPVVKYESVDLGGGYEASVRILYPPGYDQSGQEKYPMVQFVYAGPNTQSVLEEWYRGMLFETYLASKRRYIVVTIDGRGSGNRGTKYKQPVYRNLGGFEISDQITAARALANKLNVIDSEKMAVWGWSYGGFATAAMIERGAFSNYKCAASVAPVTNFRYYDAAYIERYMGLYSDKGAKNAYERTNLLTNVSQFANGKFLLIHGTADDNVHFQNSAMLADALTQNNIQFSYMVYTNGDHGMVDKRNHLYSTLDKFFHDCFNKSKQYEH